MWLRQLGLLWRQSWKPLLAVGLVLAVGLAVIGYLDRDERHVRQACEAAVAKELKSPATAEYEHTDTWEPQPGSWRDTGTVDSQNEYGALIRSAFECEARRDAGGEWVTVAFLS